MIKNYPFSVILNTENNPYYTTSGGRQQLSYGTGDSAVFNKIKSQLNEAISYVEFIYQEQKEMYNNFNSELLSLGNGKIKSLDDVFREQYSLFDDNDTTDKEKIQITQLQDQSHALVQELQIAQREFHNKFLAATEKIIQATTKQQLEEYSLQVLNEANKIETLMRSSFLKFQNDNEAMLKRFLRIKHTKKEAINIDIVSGALNITFENKKATQEDIKRQEEMSKIFQEYFNVLKDIKNQGGNSRFAQSSTFRKKHSKQDGSGLWDRYQKIRQKIDSTESDALIRSIYSRNNIQEFYNLCRTAIFFNDGSSESTLRLTAKDFGEALVQAAAFFSEGVLVESVAQTLKAALDNSGSSVQSFVVSGSTRVQFSELPSGNDKTKILNDLYNRRDEIDLSLEKIYRSNRVLDKVDTYIAVDFKHQDNTNKYILAFSNKLYNDLSKLTILGKQSKELLTEEGEHLGALGTNLINTYDLIAQLGALSDNFIFNVLNKSSASILSPEIPAESLEKWLSTFIQEIAFNPASFVQTVKKELGEAFAQSNIIYIFNAGASIKPIHEILERLIGFLRNTEVNLQSCLSTKIQYDNSNPENLLQLVSDDEYREKNSSNKSETRYTRDAWETVANAVARNTLFSIHLDLSSLAQ